MNALFHPHFLLYFTTLAHAVPLDHSSTHTEKFDEFATKDSYYSEERKISVILPDGPRHSKYREERAYYLVGDIRHSYHDEDETKGVPNGESIEVTSTSQTRRRESEGQKNDQTSNQRGTEAPDHGKTNPQPWPDGIVPYKLQENYPNWLLDLILRAMEELETEVSGGATYSSVGRTSSEYERPPDCIRFRERWLWERQYLEIRDEGSCHASLGFNARERPVLSISAHCARLSTLKHQLLHILGFQHEHNRPDRDRFVNVHWDNVMSEAEFRLRPWAKAEIDIPYDYESILHFGPYTGSRDPLLPSLTPRHENGANVQNLGQIHHLSSNDVRRVQRHYGCKEKRLSSSSPPSKVLLSCKFENDACGFLDRSELYCNDQTIRRMGDALCGDEINADDPKEKPTWTVVSGAAPDGPAAGSNTGIDSYFYVSTQLQRWVDTGDISVVDSAKENRINQNSQNDARLLEGMETLEQNYGGFSADLAVLLGISVDSEGPGQQPQTASTFSPLFTPSSKSGTFCVNYQLLQTDPRGGITLILHSEMLSTESGKKKTSASGHSRESSEVLDDYNGIVIEGWSWSGLTVQSKPGMSHRLELRATITGGSVAIDDILVLDRPCA